ncbi:hypothetical protein ABGB07_28075 [Micromonosporaceae bacterium B7E4]
MRSGDDTDKPSVPITAAEQAPDLLISLDRKSQEDELSVLAMSTSLDGYIAAPNDRPGYD